MLRRAAQSSYVMPEAHENQKQGKFIRWMNVDSIAYFDAAGERSRTPGRVTLGVVQLIAWGSPVSCSRIWYKRKS